MNSTTVSSNTKSKIYRYSQRRTSVLLIVIVTLHKGITPENIPDLYEGTEYVNKHISVKIRDI